VPVGIDKSLLAAAAFGFNALFVNYNGLTLTLVITPILGRWLEFFEGDSAGPVRSNVDVCRRRGGNDAAMAGVVGARHRGRRRMLGLGVAAQIDLALERPGTDAAGERLESGVLTTVRDEVRRLAEGLAALATNVRLFACSRNTHKTLSRHPLISV